MTSPVGKVTLPVGKVTVPISKVTVLISKVNNVSDKGSLPHFTVKRRLRIFHKDFKVKMGTSSPKKES